MNTKRSEKINLTEEQLKVVSGGAAVGNTCPNQSSNKEDCLSIYFCDWHAGSKTECQYNGKKTED